MKSVAPLLLAALMTLPAAAEDDPHQWLETVDSQAALDWVRARNAAAAEALQSEPGFAAHQRRLRSIFDSDERIPEVEQLGDRVYNFWRDAEHPRGVWRRTTRSEYRKAAPDWETVLDLDALAAEEDRNWVWKGAQCLYPEYRRCLLRLSRGGADAHVVREFDTVTRRFVDDGFVLAEAKHGVAWRDADSLLVATDTGADSLTESGYPRVVLQWRRGTPIDAARVLYEGRSSDVAVDISVYHAPDHRHELIRRAITFFRYQYFLRAGEHLARLAVPEDADVELFDEQMLLHLRSDWHITGEHYPAGSLLAMPLVAFIEGRRRFDVLFEPGTGITLDRYERTRHTLLLNLLDRVRGRVAVLRLQDGRWQRRDLEVPDLARVHATAIDPDRSDDFFLTVEDYLRPTELYEYRDGQDGGRVIKRLPHYFSAAGLRIDQHQARSRDGTRVPYFVVGPADAASDNVPRPTLLYGYGGFEIALTPGYQPATGAAWLEPGGVYVVANIRGGGEFGPQWHQAALREKRQNAYDDFIAVAEDLIRRGITTPQQLGIVGGSNGGLLVGVAMTQRPELFGAVVCRVPLLDMRRYHRLLAGASWMSEYGDPDDPLDWAYLSRYSPYQNLHADREYPPILLMTSTRDDRVHPAHARKFAARLQAQDHEVLYYENIEGGHGGAANNAQRAYMDTLAYAFLWKRLRPGD